MSDRRIIGFSLDADGDWVAELSCGHRQHARHKPPWELRPWVLTEQGRRDHVGALLSCIYCRMPTLPAGAECYQSTREFDESTVPAALLARHTLKSDLWARIVVGEGRLLYVVERDPEESYLLRPEVPGIVAPEVPHHVEARGHVRFHVEFFRVPPVT